MHIESAVRLEHRFQKKSNEGTSYSLQFQTSDCETNTILWSSFINTLHSL